MEEGVEVMAIIEVESKKIYIEEYGKENKDTIVYFHGGPGASCLDFINQAKALGTKFHVVSFDQYGAMRSESIKENDFFGMNDHIKLIDKIREKLNISKWTVIGHSYGGMLACLYAHEYPAYTERVIYDCPSWNYILSAKSIASFYMPYFTKYAILDGIEACHVILKKVYENREEVFDDLLVVLNLVKDEKERNYLHNISAEEYRASFMPQEIPDGGWQKSNIHLQKLFDAGEILNDYLPFLKEIRCPSLLLVGKYDPACGADQREYFLNNSPRGKIMIFENSGHFARIEEPEVYTQAVVDFMNNTV
jgi:proline iminopeptidase